MQEGYPRKGQCNSCGFLAKLQKHYNAPPPYIYEMPNNSRQSGVVRDISTIGNNCVACHAICYVGVDIFSEIHELEQQNKGEMLAVRTVIEKDRQCPKWVLYEPGFSPQEHKQKLDAAELELERRKFELQLSQIAQDQNARNQRVNFWLTVVLGGFAIVEVIATILQLVYPNGWPWLQDVFRIKH